MFEKLASKEFQFSKFKIPLLPAVVSLISFLVLAVFVYPGALSTDSIDQMMKERLGKRGDWHPPVMSLLWGLAEKIIPGQWGMQLLLLLAWSFFLFLFLHYLWSQRHTEKFKTYWGLLLVLAFLHLPPSLGMLGTIWKDSFMAVFMALGALLVCLRNKSILGIGVLFIAMLFRHNAVTALFPFLCFFVLRVFRPHTFFKTLACLGLGVFATLMFYFAGNVVNQKLLTIPSSWPLQQILLHDLVGIRKDTRSDSLRLVPRYKNDILPHSSETPGFYHPESVVHLYCCDPKLKYFSPADTTADQEGLKKAWIKDITHYPAAYIKHRLRVFNTLLAFQGDSCMPFHWGLSENSYGLTLPHNPYSEIRLKIMGRLKNTFLFRGYFWIGLNLVLSLYWLLQLLRKQALQPVSALFAWSGFFYWLPYVTVATTCDLRMLYWTLISSVVALITLRADRTLKTTSEF